MPNPDPSLQELIVRALTGTDAKARQALESAAAKDPELKQFSDDLHQVVDLLVGSKKWRDMTPTASMTIKIREAVMAKLPSAPPQFRTVMLENDLGGRKTATWLVILVVAGLACIGIGLSLLQGNSQDGGVRLSGTTIYESQGNKTPLDPWRAVSTTQWITDAEGGLSSRSSDEPAAIYFGKGLDAREAAAFEVDVSQPGLDEKTTIQLFIAASETQPAQPTFTSGGRPDQALQLDIGRDGLILMAPNRTLLQSRPVSSANPGFIRLRLEHLGKRVRVMLNNEVFFDGFNPAPLKGMLYPGMRVAGPKQSFIRFNAIRLER